MYKAQLSVPTRAKSGEKPNAATSRSLIPASYPQEWSPCSDDVQVYEYAPLRLPRELSHKKAAMRLAVESEFSGWELTRVRRYTDGSRKVLMRRKKAPVSLYDAQSPVAYCSETKV